MHWRLLLHHVVSDGHLTHHLAWLLALGHHHLSLLLTHHLLLLRIHLSHHLTTLHLHLLLVGWPHGHTKPLSWSNWPHKPILHLHGLVSLHWRPHSRLRRSLSVLWRHVGNRSW